MKRIDKKSRVVNNHLSQIGDSFMVKQSATSSQSHAVFKCRCGKSIIAVPSVVAYGSMKSCGCWNSEVLLTRSTTHGNASVGKHSSTYKTWRAMRSRVAAKPGTHHGKRYADRGITICDEWNDFSVFLAEMGERPKGTTIERKKNDEGYSKENCIWATNAEQCRNRSNNHIVEFGGVLMCLKDAAKQAGIGYLTAYQRIRKMGWSVEKALTTPTRKRTCERS